MCPAEGIFHRSARRNPERSMGEAQRIHSKPCVRGHLLREEAQWVAIKGCADISTYRVHTHVKHFSDRGASDGESARQRRSCVEGSERAEMFRPFIPAAEENARNKVHPSRAISATATSIVKTWLLPGSQHGERSAACAQGRTLDPLAFEGRRRTLPPLVFGGWLGGAETIGKYRKIKGTIRRI